MEYEQLKLSNQVCFPVYAASRLITREYQPFLEKMGITYPQYLVLLVLWEQNGITVNEIARKLLLNTNTITPLLKRMEVTGFLNRKRSGDDERKVLVFLSEKGFAMKSEAATIPEKLVSRLEDEFFSLETLFQLRDQLNHLICILSSKEPLG